MNKRELPFKIPATQWFLKQYAKVNPFLPKAAIIEPTTRCNLSCWSCLRNKLTRPIQDMTLSEFMFVLESIPTLKKIDLFFMGEPFIHPDIWEMIKMAEGSKIKTHIATNSTFLFDYLDEIMNSPLSALSLSMDGLSPETMSNYRIGSDFEKTFEGIKRYLAAPKKTKVTVRFLVFKQNQHEIPTVTGLCKEFGVILHLVAPILDWGYKKLPEDRKQFMSTLPEFQRYNEQGIIRQPQFCGHEWKPVISVTGEILPCCYDVNGEYSVGNLFKQDFYKIFWSKAYRQLRKKMWKRQLPLCKTCKHSVITPYVEVKP